MTSIKTPSRVLRELAEGALDGLRDIGKVLSRRPPIACVVDGANFVDVYPDGTRIVVGQLDPKRHLHRPGEVLVVYVPSAATGNNHIHF
jgi:hypothetical protein